MLLPVCVRLPSSIPIPHFPKCLLPQMATQVLDIFGWRDRVAVWRRVSPIATRDGTQQPAISIVDVWTVRDGLVRCPGG